MCDPPLNSSHEVGPSPFGAHFHCCPSPLRPQPSPHKKKRTFPKSSSILWTKLDYFFLPRALGKFIMVCY